MASLSGSSDCLGTRYHCQSAANGGGGPSLPPNHPRTAFHCGQGHSIPVTCYSPTQMCCMAICGALMYSISLSNLNSRLLSFKKICLILVSHTHPPPEPCFTNRTGGEVVECLINNKLVFPITLDQTAERPWEEIDAAFHEQLSAHNFKLK